MPECKWPIGDPRSPDFRFCAKRQTPGRPYCLEHTRIAYEPEKPPKQVSQWIDNTVKVANGRRA